VQSPAFAEKWRTKILIFGKKWMSHDEDPEWAPFYYHMLKMAWTGANSRYSRDIYIWQALFSYIQNKREIKASQHLHDLVMHLFGMAAGVMPGFKPANDDLCAPIRRLQEIYIEDYGLKDYAPIIMVPTHFDYTAESTDPIYYSLHHPTSLALTPPNSKQTTILTDLYKSSALIQKYLREILDGQGLFCQDNTRIFKIAKAVQYHFFHNTIEGYSQICEAKEIAEIDQSFMSSWKNTANNEFPKNCSFFNGCIQISKKLTS
jgi:hypothetical protein